MATWLNVSFDPTLVTSLETLAPQLNIALLPGSVTAPSITNEVPLPGAIGQLPDAAISVEIDV